MATNYKAAAWFLQHRYPKQWGTVEKRELMGKDGGPIQQEVTHNASDDMRAFLNDDKLRRAIIRLEGEFAGAGQDDAARTRGADLGKPLEGTGSPPTDSRPSS
jgi:hypothetical protein